MKEAAFLSGAAFGIALMALVGAALFWLRHRDGSAIWRIVADFFDWVSRVSYTAARAAETAIRIHDMVKAGGAEGALREEEMCGGDRCRGMTSIWLAD